MAQKVTSTDIKLALKEFHNGKPSYFITECKTCSTYFPDPQGLLKFDGLAITKSYTKPNIIGYEIKVSRNDFLQDNKWHLYLQYCNEFYFVVPKGLVKKEELPDHVGLIYFNPDTKGLRTVKKALYRQIEEPVGVYKYIIFSRLEEDRIPFYNDRAEYCRDYLEDIGVIQDKLNITGTTAREAEQTFSGSFAMMKASVTNLLGNLSIGDGEAVARSMGELVESASTFFFGNFIPMLQTIFSNLPTAIGTAVEKVAPQIKENVLPLLTSIKDAIFTGLGNIGIDTGALQAIFDQLFNVKVDGGGITSMFSGLKDGIVQAINTILPIIPPIISAVQQIAPVVGQVISTIMSGVSQIIPYIVPVIQTITNIIVTAMPVIQQIITVVVGAIVAIMPTLSSIFTFVGNVIQQVLTVIGNHMGLFQTIVSVVKSMELL